MDKVIAEIKEKAKIIRRDIIKMLGESQSGHPGGSLSAADIVATLYFHVMDIDPKKPRWEERDKLVLSKGHACPVIYAALAEKGFFPKEELMKLRKVNNMLQGHPDMKGTPGVEMTTGSLGQGLSAAVGMALAGRVDRKDYTVYVIVGDGESQEGQIWEAAMAAGHFKLGNLIGFHDHNGLQIDGCVCDIMNVEPLADKWKAFGWYVLEIDGHDIEQIIDAVEKAKKIKDKPVMIVAKTVKGKGVSFMENVVGFHGKAPNQEQVKQALEELR